MPITVKNMDQRVTAETVVKWWKDWKVARKKKESIWLECLQHYSVEVDESAYDDWPWRCKVSRPMTQEIVDAICSAVKGALFPMNEDFFMVEGLDEIGKEFETEVNKHLKDILFNMRYTQMMDPFLKQICQIGNSAAEVVWDDSISTHRRWLNDEIVEEEDALQSHIRIVVQDMFDVVYTTEASVYTQDTPRIHRSLTTLDKLKDDKALYGNLNKIAVQNSGRSASFTSTDPNSQSADRRLRGGVDQNVPSIDSPVELLTLTGDFMMDGRMFKDHIVTVANGDTVIRFEPSVYFSGNPVVFANYSTMLVQEPLGWGPAEPIKGNQKLVDTFSCQKADIINLNMGGVWAVGKRSQYDASAVVNEPHNIVFLNDVNDIKSLVPSANPTLAFSEINDLREESERSSGASRFAQGATSSGRRTATESQLIGAGASNRFNDITTQIGEMAIEPSLNMILQHELQFNYKNPQFSSMPFGAWDGRYRVKFNGARNSALKAIALQQFIQFEQLILTSPVFSQFIQPDELIKENLSMFGIRNEKIVRTTPLNEEFPSLAEGKQGEAGSSDAKESTLLRNQNV